MGGIKGCKSGEKSAAKFEKRALWSRMQQADNQQLKGYRFCSPFYSLGEQEGLRLLVIDGGGIQNSKIKTQKSKLKIQNSKLKTQNSKFKTQNSKLKIQNSKIKTQNSKLKNQNSKFKNQNS